MRESPWDNQSLTSVPFDELDGYEKGVAARALLEHLIKQGGVERGPTDARPGVIVISIQRWQWDLLARFSRDSQAIEHDDREIFLDKLCQVR